MNASNPITLNIQGMTCRSCAAHVERALADVPGVESARVDLGAKSATVQGTALELSDLLEAVEAAGYTGTKA
jgi:Cu+-exporting ATPase